MEDGAPRMSRKWLIGDHKTPKDRVVGPLPNGRTPWLLNGGYQLLTSPGMILQEEFFFVKDFNFRRKSLPFEFVNGKKKLL